MEERVLIKGEFNNKVYFTRGILTGLVVGFIMDLILGLFGLLSEPIVALCVGVACYIVTPVYYGFFMKKQERELTITNVEFTLKQGTLITKIAIDDITSFDAITGMEGRNAIMVQAPPRKCRVAGVKNAGEIVDVLKKLLDDRKKAADAAKPAIVNTTTVSSADELKKYKELLDMGAITQEEFDAKKKELLNL